MISEQEKNLDFFGFIFLKNPPPHPKKVEIFEDEKEITESDTPTAEEVEEGDEELTEDKEKE